MPLPRGVDPKTAALGYMEALHGFPIDAIALGIRRFLRGECTEVSPKFCPHPPELANIVRTTRVNAGQKPEPRGYVPSEQELPGANDRMRLKMPMYSYAQRNGLMEQLAAANRDGFEAMVVLATKWGIAIPPELFERDTADEWRRARNRIWVELERNPPPFMRSKKWPAGIGR